MDRDQYSFIITFHGEYGGKLVFITFLITTFISVHSSILLNFLRTLRL